MYHLIKYSIIRKVRNFSILFWPLVFPLVLGTLFYMAFGNLDEADFETVQAAVVKEKGSDQVFLAFLGEMQEGGNLVHAEEMTEEEAEQALEEQEISGVFYAGETPYLKVNGSGISQSILQSILESYQGGKQTLTTVAQKDPLRLPAAVSRMADYQDMTKQVSLGGRTTDGNSTFFYALVAMACLYGCFIGQGSARWLQANLSALAARQCASSMNRLVMVLTELISSFLLHFINVLILLAYLRYILRMDFQGDLPRMLLVVFAGCVTGVALGILIYSMGRWKENIKIGIILGVTMTASFLAGLMFAQMKYIVDRHAPVINRLNPAALIADAFYCINVYDDPERFARDLITLSVICIILVTLSFLAVRRERYDSI